MIEILNLADDVGDGRVACSVGHWDSKTWELVVEHTVRGRSGLEHVSSDKEPNEAHARQLAQIYHNRWAAQVRGTPDPE
jgi:hypothetical protein